jgi:hypothetical protein
MRWRMSAFGGKADIDQPLVTNLVYEYTAWSPALLAPLPAPTGGDRATENGIPVLEGCSTWDAV